MNIQSVQIANNTNFQGKTKKTPRGNEYKTTNLSKNIGGTVGLLSGALASKIALVDKMKTMEGKRMFITSLNNQGHDLNSFGKVGQRAGIVGKGIGIVAGAVTLAGLLIGRIIGGTVDSHNNLNRAKQADKVAKEHP